MRRLTAAQERLKQSLASCSNCSNPSHLDSAIQAASQAIGSSLMRHGSFCSDQEKQQQQQQHLRHRQLSCPEGSCGSNAQYQSQKQQQQQQQQLGEGRMHKSFSSPHVASNPCLSTVSLPSSPRYSQEDATSAQTNAMSASILDTSAEAEATIAKSSSASSSACHGCLNRAYDEEREVGEGADEYMSSKRSNSVGAAASSSSSSSAAVAATAAAAAASRVRPPLWEVLRCIAELGLLSVGDSSRHLSLLRAAVVDHRQWLTPAEFNRIHAYAYCLPGPTSLQMVVVMGAMWLGGLWGGMAALLLRALPGVLLLLALSLVASSMGLNDASLLTAQWFTEFGPRIPPHQPASTLSELSIGILPASLACLLFSSLRPLLSSHSPLTPPGFLSLASSKSLLLISLLGLLCSLFLPRPLASFTIPSLIAAAAWLTVFDNSDKHHATHVPPPSSSSPIPLPSPSLSSLFAPIIRSFPLVLRVFCSRAWALMEAASGQGATGAGSSYRGISSRESDEGAGGGGGGGGGGVEMGGGQGMGKGWGRRAAGSSSSISSSSSGGGMAAAAAVGLGPFGSRGECCVGINCQKEESSDLIGGELAVSVNAARLLLLGWFLGLVTLVTARHLSMSNWGWLVLGETFFRTASMAMGDETLVLSPMLFQLTIDNGLMSPPVLIVLSIAAAQLCPGHVVMAGIFFGTYSQGISGFAAAAIGLALPTLLSSLSLLPWIDSLDSRRPAAVAAQGARAMAGGIEMGALLLVILDSVTSLGSLATFMLTLFLLAALEFSTPFSLLVGTIIGCCLYQVDIGGPYCWVTTYTMRNEQYSGGCLAWHNFQYEKHILHF